MALRADKYFQDYDVEVTLYHGKERRNYVYKGDLYVRRVTDKARQKERAAYVILSILSAVLLAAAMLQPSDINVGGFFAACSILELIPAFCIAEGSAEAFFRKGDLKKSNYQERLLMLRVMPVIGAVLGIVLSAGYLYGALQESAAGANAAALMCAAASAVCDILIAVREFRIGYQIIPGERNRG
jgi:hypothetical protein